MKFLIFYILYSCYVLTEADEKIQALSHRHLTNLQQAYSNKLKCIKRLDEILSSKWNQDLAKINTKDLGNVEPENGYVSPSKQMYNTVEQEWLMESGSSSNEINSCLRNTISQVIPLIDRTTIKCLNSIFDNHIKKEIVHENVFKEWLKNENKKQLPFRRFMSFLEFGDLVFQSRTPDALGDNERNVYEHAASYLTTETEKTIDRTYILEQECEWQNAMAIRSASGLEGRLNEFVNQVKDSVNQQLANRIVRNWNLNTRLSLDEHKAWSRLRNNMTSTINAEVDKLRNARKDPQYLCEYATKVARDIVVEQFKVFSREGESVDLSIDEVAAKTRGIEKALEKLSDFRYSVVKSLANEFTNRTRCVQAFLHMLENHYKYDIARYFVDRNYNYPQLHCKYQSASAGLIQTQFCKCVGSFCVAHPLAALFAEEYTLVQQPDGKFKVVLSGLKSREKVNRW